MGDTAAPDHVPMQYGFQGGSLPTTQDGWLHAVRQELYWGRQPSSYAGGSVDEDGNSPTFGNLLDLLNGFDCPERAAEFKVAYTSTLRRFTKAIS